MTAARVEVGTLSPTDRWSIDRSNDIDWREWGEEFVVRVASRAETHLLSAAAGAVLRALLEDQQALSLEALYAGAFQDVDSGNSDDQSMPPSELESLQTIVGDLERLGLVTRSST